MSDSFEVLCNRQSQVLKAIEKARMKLEQVKIDHPIQDTGKVDKTIHHWEALQDQSRTRIDTIIKREQEEIVRAKERMEREIREATEMYERKVSSAEGVIRTQQAELDRLTGFYRDNVTKLNRAREHILTNLPPKVAKAQAELDAELARQKSIESLIKQEIQEQRQSGPTGTVGPLRLPTPPPVVEKKSAPPPIKKVVMPDPVPVVHKPAPPPVNTVVLPAWDSEAVEEEEEEDADAFEMRSFMAYVKRKKEDGEFEYDGLIGYPAWQKWEKMSIERWPGLKKDMYKDF